MLIRNWCLTCVAMVKPACLEAHHQTRDLLEEVAQCQTEVEEVVKGFEKGDEMRGNSQTLTRNEGITCDPKGSSTIEEENEGRSGTSQEPPRLRLSSFSSSSSIYTTYFLVC